MRIVITGGAGFLGSHLSDRCLAEGHEVVAVDNFITGSRDNVAHISSPKFSLLEQNISDGIAVDGAVDFIFNLASPASPVDYAELPIETLKVGADLQKLYDYLHNRGSFVALDNYKPEYLSIFSRDVLQLIAAGDSKWEAYVPEAVSDIVKKRGFFGYNKAARS